MNDVAYFVYWRDEMHTDLITSFFDETYSVVFDYTKKLRDTEAAKGATNGRYEICEAFRELIPAQGYYAECWGDWEIVEVMDVFDLVDKGN